MAVVEIIGEHFTEQWAVYVGGDVPDVRELNALIAEGVFIRPQMVVLKRKKGRWEPYKLLSEYWILNCGLIVKVDEDAKKAVTIITPSKLLCRAGNRMLADRAAERR